MKVKEFLSDPIHVGIVSVLTTVLVILGFYTLYVEESRSAPVVAPANKEPIKSLVLEETDLINVDASIARARLKGYTPSQTYIIDYVLVNNGDIPIVAEDFSVPPAIITSTPNEIKEVVSTNPDDIQGKGAGSHWTQVSKTEWKLEPRLLNPHQQMPFTVTFQAGSHPVPSDYSPEANLNWRWDVVGVNDVPTVASFPTNKTKAYDFSQDYLRIISFLNGSTSFMKINTYFSFISYTGQSVYWFLINSLIFYAIGLWVLLSYNKTNGNIYIIIAHAIIALILSFSIADAVTTFAVVPIKQVLLYNYPAPLPYLGYLAYLILKHKKQATKAIHT